MSTRRVILLIESSSAYGRRCLLGVARYARLHGHWTFWQKPGFSSNRLNMTELSQWQGTGIISRIESPQVLQTVCGLSLPTIDVRSTKHFPNIPCITTDSAEVVRLAMEHLRAKGYRRTAYCGVPGLDFSDARQEAFIRLHEQVQQTYDLYQGPPGRRKGPSRIDASEQYESPEQLALQRWLCDLPKPVGVITCSDRRGRQVLEACVAMGLRVPYDVGVVGVDNDEVICELSDPPLTSVAPHVEAVGYEAARLLDAMMEGQSVEQGEHPIAPLGVQLRSSTDTTVVQDRELSMIIKYIDAHLDEGVNVAELAHHAALSRSSLERRFREHLGCTPRAYLLRRRVGRIQQLLKNPELKLSEVARRCSFKTTSHMVSLFRTHTGQTPSDYRRGIT